MTRTDPRSAPRDASRLMGFLHRRAMRWNAHLVRTTAKLAVFLVLAGVLLVGLAIRVGNLSFFSHTVGYQAQLPDVTGLRTGDAVKIAGVSVGTVTGISVQRDHALVQFDVNRGIDLRTSTDAGLQWHNVLGQQFLYLYPGATGAVMAPGSTIPLSHAVASASIGQFLNALGPFLGAINPSQANAFVEGVLGALQGNEARVDQLIDSSASVSSTLGSLDSQVGAVISNLQQVFSALAARSGDLSSVIANFDTSAAALASRNDVLDQVVANLGKVQGDLSGLMGANRSNLDSAIADLDAVTAEIRANEGSLAKGLHTLGSGLAPYTLISSYGQWFEVQTVYTCLAAESSCSYYQPTNAPKGAGPGGGIGPASPQGPGAPGPPAMAGAPAPGSGQGGTGTESVGAVLQIIAGQYPAGTTTGNPAGTTTGNPAGTTTGSTAGNPAGNPSGSTGQSTGQNTGQSTAPQGAGT